MNGAGPAIAFGLFGGEPRNLAPPVVDVNAAAVRVGAEHADRNGIGQCLVARFTLAPLLLLRTARGNIPYHRHIEARAGLGWDRFDSDLGREHGAVAAAAVQRQADHLVRTGGQPLGQGVLLVAPPGAGQKQGQIASCRLMLRIAEQRDRSRTEGADDQMFIQGDDAVGGGSDQLPGTQGFMLGLAFGGAHAPPPDDRRRQQGDAQGMKQVGGESVVLVGQPIQREQPGAVRYEYGSQHNEKGRNPPFPS